MRCPHCGRPIFPKEIAPNDSINKLSFIYAVDGCGITVSDEALDMVYSVLRRKLRPKNLREMSRFCSALEHQVISDELARYFQSALLSAHTPDDSLSWKYLYKSFLTCKSFIDKMTKSNLPLPKEII